MAEVYLLTTKLTPAENEVFDWLFRSGMYESKSAMVRELLLEAAKLKGIQSQFLKDIEDQRKYYAPRRSAKLARLIGRKEKRRRGI